MRQHKWLNNRRHRTLRELHAARARGIREDLAYIAADRAKLRAIGFPESFVPPVPADIFIRTIEGSEAARLRKLTELQKPFDHARNRKRIVCGIGLALIMVAFSSLV